MSPSDFLATAEKLVATSPTEADCRSCISRAYYAVFLTVQKILVDRISVALLRARLGRRRPMHGPIITCLKGCADSKLRRIGEHLGNLHAARVLADYRLDKFVTEAKAAGELANARDLLQDVTDFGEAELAGTVERHLKAPG